MAGLHIAVIEAVGNGRGVIELRLADLLAKIDFAFLPLRGKGSNIQTVVVKNCVEDLESLLIQELRNFVTDDAALLQASQVGPEGQGLIAAADVEPGDIESHPGAYAGGSCGSSGS